MRKQKYDWETIAKDYQDGMQNKDICKKYNMEDEKYLRKKMRKLKLKRPECFKQVRVWTPEDIKKLKHLNSLKLSQKRISEVLSKSLSSVKNICIKLNLKSKNKIKKRKFTFLEAQDFRNKYYRGIWINKSIREIADFLGVSGATFCDILNYRLYTLELNLTPEQIHALHQEMKQKRKELQQDL